MDFRSLQHIRRRRSTDTGFAYPLRSVLRVWLPSRRLSPFGALPALFRASSAHGIRPSERSPLPGYPGVSARVNPPAVSPVVAPPPKAGAGPTGRGSWALTPARVPCEQRWFRAPTAGCSRGLCPLQGTSAKTLAGISPSRLSRASPDRPSADPSAPQSIDQSSLSPADLAASRADGQGHPRRVSAPVRSRAFGRGLTRAYWFASRRVVRYRRPADAPWVTAHILPELSGSPEVPSLRDLSVAP